MFLAAQQAQGLALEEPDCPLESRGSDLGVGLVVSAPSWFWNSGFVAVRQRLPGGKLDTLTTAGAVLAGAEADLTVF